MSLNIKNGEVYRLASELAELTGQSMTAIVLDALRKERQQIDSRQQKQARVDELMAIGRRCADHIKQPVAAVDHDDMLYDERGMPQ
jgi:antitoxin VapB